MTRDYANKRKHYQSAPRDHAGKSRGKTNNSLVINFNPMLLLVIVIGGIFMTTIFYLEHIKDYVSKSQKELVVAKTQAKSVVKTNKEVISRMPKFEFYHTLPKMEVAINNKDKITIKEKSQLERTTVKDDVIDVASTSQLVPVVEGKPTTITIKNNQETNNKKQNNNVLPNYSLQLASFKDLKDADELKVKLLMAGYDVHIQTVTLDNGDVWHRVKTTKLPTLALAEEVGTQLRKYNLKSIVVVDRG